jgi:ATP-dependent RNA helicase DDX46/PRP5
MISHHLICYLDSTKPTLALNRAALGSLGLKGLPVRADALKASKTVASLDDSVELTRKLQNLSDLPAVDMTIVENGRSIGENLEAEDDEDEVKMEVDLKPNSVDAMDEDDEDPLDAFMTNVKAEVSKVDADDRKKMSKHRQTRRLENDPELEEPNVDYEAPIDELDMTELNPEDILALAAKKARKKDLAVVDHAKIVYEPFRKAFYHPPPDIAELTEDDAELLRLELDGIKIRGVDCPKPVTKWSHFGMPSSW